jgi:Holin of 3TMs, for gene-transfer release
MATTILPKKAGFEQPMALTDEHHELLVADPSIQQFPQGGSNAFNTSSGSSAFGAPSTGGFGPSGSFGSSGSYSSPSFNQQSNSGFGSTQNTNQSTGSQPVLTGAAPTNAASGADVLVANDNADWINKKWRPAMGWLYMLTCFFDFVIFPILWSLLQAMSKGTVTSQWQPLTLQGAGLYHIAMGAVLGIAAYGRTKEKLESKQ